MSENRPESGCPEDGVLARLLDGTLPEGDRAAVERHAAECAGCRRLLVLSTRAIEKPAPAVTWKVGAAAAAAVIAAGLLWLILSRTPAPKGGPGEPTAAPSERAQIAAAMKGLVTRGYPAIEVTRLVARTAGTGIRGRDMVELVQAMEKAACGRKDPSRLRDEVIEAAEAGASGPALRRIIRDRLQGLPVLQETDERKNG